MKLKVKELSALCRNCGQMEEYLRGCIGSALSKAIYDPACTDEFDDEYKELGEGWFYNCPSEEDIFKCLDYLVENEREDEELELDVV